MDSPDPSALAQGQANGSVTVSGDQKAQGSVGCLAVSVIFLGVVGSWLLIIAANTLDATQSHYFSYPGYLFVGLALLGVVPLADSLRRRKAKTSDPLDLPVSAELPAPESAKPLSPFAVGCFGTMAIGVVTVFALIQALMFNLGYTFACVIVLVAMAATIMLWRGQFKAKD